MDIFFHSPSFEQNVRADQVGQFGFNSPKIVELAQRLPKRVWVFKTPRGMKGSIQLVASVLVTDEPTVAVNNEHKHVLFYDVFSPGSVIYTDSATPERIEEVSAYFQYRWHAAFSSAFKGDAALQPLEANVLRGLEAMVAGWETVQLLERASDKDAVRPINPFARSR
ncbi:hypothetical protein QCE63_17945 [Caballeronia sp. LZ065]|uniref:hypothetical protein n=1 Tax=Caballeronia sp. LZ065 TaxID=3038571 RepID=UPI00285C1405|nr:hypothetical protein [Caballeronia sp. LZ065]MDR5781286.1 hypothetical protein [Caballeronia sp. LZ065]